jgi:hypothetical protein
MSGQPVLSWARVSGAAEYEVQLDDESSFGSPFVALTTTNRRATPTVNLPQGDLWWRVRGVATSGVKGSWAVATFTSTAYAPPTLISPGDGESLQQPDAPVLLTWSPVIRATSYTVEIDDDANFPSPRTSSTTRSTWFLAEDSGLETDWYWRVRANFSGTFSSAWGETRSFRVNALAAPVLVSPGNSPSTQVQDAVLDWLPVAGAVRYELEVSTDDQFNSFTDRVTVVSTRYARPRTYNNDQYWWRVRGIDINGNASPWTTSLFQFQRSWPDAPEHIYPADGATVGNPFYYQWEPIEHASSYQLQVSQDENFNSGVSTCTTNATTYTPRSSETSCMPAAGALHFWRVRAIDGAGNVLSLLPGTGSSFTYTPAVVQQLSPADGTTGVDIPTLAWAPYAEAIKYEVVVRRANGTVAKTATTYATSWTPTGTDPLNPADGPFRWTVQAIGKDNARTQIPILASSWTFSLSGDTSGGSAAPLTPLSPADGAQSLRFPALRWEPIFDGNGDPANYYKVWISRQGSAGQAELGDAFPYPAGTDDTDDHLLTGTYTWYVEAYMLDGSRVSGPSRTFVIENLGGVSSERLSLTGTGLANDATTCDNYISTPSPTTAEICGQLQQTPVLAWDEVPNAGYYRVFISHDRSLTNLVNIPSTANPVETSSTRLALTTLLPDSQAGDAYYWYVQACKAPDICSPNPVGQLNIANNAFDKRSNPVSGLTVAEHDGGALGGTIEVPVFQDEIVLSWDPYLETSLAGNGLDVTGMPATIEARDYRVQLSSDPNFAPNAAYRYTSPLLDQTSFSIYDRTFPEGTLFWRVQAVDGSGNSLAWSLSRDLSSEAVELQKISPRPHLAQPADGSTTAGAPLFRWDPLAYAARYRIEVYKNGDTTFSGANRVLSGITEQAAFAPSDVLPPSGSPYVWRVRRIDASNLEGGWSAIGRFNVKGSAPALVSPAAGAYVSPRDAYFSWRAVSAATSYRIERRIPGETSLVESVQTVGLAWSPTDLLPSGRYEWRVSAYDLKGSLLGSSAWRQFRVDATAPRVVKRTPVRTATRRANFVVDFSEPVRGVGTTTMALFAKGQQHRLSATVRMSNGNRTATLNPARNLQIGKTYTIRLLNGIKDAAGNPLSKQSWTLTVR